MSIAGRSERNRRLLHFALGFGVLLLPVLGRLPAAGVAAAAVLYNAWLAPALGLDRAYRRPGERRFSGLATYPFAVLLLLLCCPLPVAAGAWAILAWADPVAAEVGSRLRRPPVPWNRGKSLLGLGAGALAGAAGGALALRYVGGAGAALAPAGLAALAAALVETVRLPLDDNIPMAAAAGAVLLAWA